MGCAALTPAAPPEDEATACREPARPCRGSDGARVTRPSFHQRYLVGEKLGEGAFACVYSCRRADGGPGGELAVKVTDLRRAGAGQPDAPDCFPRTQREAFLLKAVVGQEHCCRFVDSMADKCFHYLVMERCSTTLYQALERMPELTEQSLATVVKQMFIAVSEVHALGILHRDVKPDSFLCEGPEATVKLCDFGFARQLPPGSACVSGVYGTAPFMSPEMVMGFGYSAPTDVWSLGVVLYVLLCGEFPYVPEKPCKHLMKVAIARGVPRPSFAPTVADVWLSSGAVELLESLLSRAPETRPSAADALACTWFGAAAEEPPSSEPPSLKEALFAAERAGAFGRPGSARGGAAPPRPGSAERTLRRLQRKCHRQGPRASAPQELEGRRPGQGALAPPRQEPEARRRPRGGGGRGRTPEDRAPGCSPACREKDHHPLCAQAPRLYDAHRLGVMIST